MGIMWLIPIYYGWLCGDFGAADLDVIIVDSSNLSRLLLQILLLNIVYRGTKKEQW